MPGILRFARSSGVLLAVLIASGGTQLPAGSKITVRFVPPRQNDQATVVEVAGLEPQALRVLQEAAPDRETWTRILGVAVHRDDSAGHPPRPMLGEYRIEDQRLIFQPRYPLKSGLTYRAVLDPGALPGGGPIPDVTARQAKPISTIFTLPARTPVEPARVTAVYPTGDNLPENQLRFYIHFSAPMSRGEAYRRMRLLDGDGQPVDHAFLELGEELWDPGGRRFTLLFDPGRIKRGLKPRELFGPVLEEGNAYTLEIQAGWLDAAGRPLNEGVRKSFKAAAPDDVQPDPGQWKLTAPTASKTGPLAVTFAEPLDHGMLERVLVVTDESGAALDGRIEIDRGETRWRFTPADAWQAGRYRLVIDTALEDRAGNSIERPFEVDVLRPIQKRLQVKTVSVPFEVRASDKLP